MGLLLTCWLFIYSSLITSFVCSILYLFIYRDLSARVRQVQQGCVWRKPLRSTFHSPHSVMSYQHWLMARAHTSHIVTQRWHDCCRILWGETLKQSWWVLADFVLTFDYLEFKCQSKHCDPWEVRTVENLEYCTLRRCSWFSVAALIWGGYAGPKLGHEKKCIQNFVWDTSWDTKYSIRVEDTWIQIFRRQTVRMEGGCNWLRIAFGGGVLYSWC